MGLLDYDYDDLARQVQEGLERIGINFLRSHGARVRRDLVDFHGHEQVDLELVHGGHSLKIHQAGRPRGFEADPGPSVAGEIEEEFDSTFDGWPADQYPCEELARWLAALPAGQAPPERPKAAPDAANPFAAERPAPLPRLEPEPSFNPFLGERAGPSGGNPFADADRDRKRQELLRRLKGDEA